MTTQPHPRFPSLRLVEHPLVLHKLSRMRDKTTPTVVFRQLLKEIALLMAYEILRELPLVSEPIKTPLGAMEAPVIAGKKLAFVPILRAGLVMAEGLHELVPSARAGHIGLYRDHETKRPVEYLVKLPETEGRLFILVDPMLATGYSARHAVEVLNRHGVADAAIRVLALVVAPEGMAMFAAAHPEVRVFAAALDDHLDERAYIVPGLGDAGDRLFGTK
jgi:uracil phosphoribosyltransferase